MTKAENVRKNWSKNLNQSLDVEVGKIFDWILDLIEEESEKFNFGPYELRWNYDECELKTEYGKSYDFSHILSRHTGFHIINTLATIINNEQGFKARLTIIDQDRKDVALVIIIFVENIEE